MEFLDTLFTTSGKASFKEKYIDSIGRLKRNYLTLNISSEILFNAFNNSQKPRDTNLFFYSYIDFKNGYKKNLKYENITDDILTVFLIDNYFLTNKKDKIASVKLKKSKNVSVKGIYDKIHGKQFCVVCKQEMKFCNFKEGYVNCKCNECTKIFSTFKRQETCLQKYNRNCSVDVEKSKETKLKRYNDCNFNNREKAKKTCLIRYDFESPMKSKEVKDKQAKTFELKYNGHPAKLKETKDKRNKTISEDIDHYKKSSEKSKITRLKKYKKYNPSKIKEDKIKEKPLRKFIKDGYFCIDEAMEHFNVSASLINKLKIKFLIIEKNKNKKNIKNFKNYNKNFIFENFIENSLFLFTSASKYFNTSGYKIKKDFNIEESHILSSISIEQKINRLFDMIFIERDRKFIKPLEVDLLNHKNKICIEYDGLIWHSIGKSDYEKFNITETDETRNKHFKKHCLVEDKGYNLISITDAEWKHKKEAWINRINILLKKETRRETSLISSRDIYDKFSIFDDFDKYNIVQLINGTLYCIKDKILIEVIHQENVWSDAIPKEVSKNINKIKLDRRFYNQGDFGLEYNITGPTYKIVLKNRKYFNSGYLESKIGDTNEKF